MGADVVHNAYGQTEPSAELAPPPSQTEVITPTPQPADDDA